MRPPSVRPASRSQTPGFYNGRSSPAESVVSAASRMRSPASQSGAGLKRKERDFEHDASEETNINVVVRCRGRSDREVRENSGVVVSTDGIKGRTVDLAMGPSALSNKTYHFDKVFSPAADQTMIFDEVVTPILDEVLSGFNCTIFAYGQTGTGKTYTMSGDITDTPPTSDSAGIIPRVLHSLFSKLDGDDFESSVKCSFIELYNEELRDLLSPDDNVKLKIFEDNNRKGHGSTLVQGMEESHIKTASRGIQLLREGSHKRQVAATKCNDLSSRSHTVFTVTVYMKRPSETGEDFVSAGKLNLVDLAGSENIQRSGAENKRAAEAGLINKSLLTLGRVINALVDRSSHIPYRESKLTRLLQDSLGGRTKTCIIATLSPAKSNLEETISTLDYAFRAKNIRNKPQVNQMVSKKTLLKEFTAEIEKLKSELIATRQRNGVYLTQESYEELTTESESRRILCDEQRDKIETMEINLRNKVQELFSLTTNFSSLKKDNEATKVLLDDTKGILEKTEAVLEQTRQNLKEETAMRKAHEKTEENLANIGVDLISTLGQTTSDLSGLHSKLRRRSDLHSKVRSHWTSSQSRVIDTTRLVDDRIAQLRDQQDSLIGGLSTRMDAFVKDEIQKLEASQIFLQDKLQSFEESEKEVNDQTAKAKNDMNEVLEEINTLREDVKEKLGAGLNDLSAAAQRISAGVIAEIDKFQGQLHHSYASLGRDFKATFDDLIKQINDQQRGADELRKQMVAANSQLLESNQSSRRRIDEVVEEQKRKSAEERETLLAQISALVKSTADSQEKRMSESLKTVSNEFESAEDTHIKANAAYNEGMDSWMGKNGEMMSTVMKSRDNIKSKIKGDFAASNEHTESLRSTTSSVHDSTTRAVSAQMAHMDTQLHSLSDIAARLRIQNDSHHNAHTTSLRTLGTSVQSSYTSIADHLATSLERVDTLATDMGARTTDLSSALLAALAPDADIRGPLAQLGRSFEGDSLEEYSPTGETPQRVQYAFPTTLPRTEGHDSLLARLRGHSFPEEGARPMTSSSARSPTKGLVFADVMREGEDSFPMCPASSGNNNANGSSNSSAQPTPSLLPPPPPPQPPSSGLRELDVNTLAWSTVVAPESGTAPDCVLPSTDAPPPSKRQNTNSSATKTTTVPLDKGAAADDAAVESKLPTKKKGARKTYGAAHTLVAEGRENMPNFSASVGPTTRRLRSHNSS
ncbi:P-loop containing nucleoside triphosphate hydrolase protein [Lineolata rhizophorae]|uniref:P-loop containing nucleoside triphosphate hydrolase protein n=1 Tax=Lineolata rhizophorae TaxID=578093 RepID=A0A6A6NRY5_9PEZI|nr:P-loop containing nucleoside triphosphate hydrolase protein [Lineolata rhizophorae]